MINSKVALKQTIEPYNMMIIATQSKGESWCAVFYSNENGCNYLASNCSFHNKNTQVIHICWLPQRAGCIVGNTHLLIAPKGRVCMWSLSLQRNLTAWPTTRGSTTVRESCVKTANRDTDDDKPSWTRTHTLCLVFTNATCMVWDIENMAATYWVVFGRGGGNPHSGIWCLQYI